MRAWGLIAVGAVVFCSAAFAQDLEIERETRTVPFFKRPAGSEGWIKQADGLYRATFQLLPGFKGHGPPGQESPPADHILEALNEMDIEFGEGTSARLDPVSGILFITNTKQQLEKVLHIVRDAMELDHAPEQQVAIRVEIYELTKLQVLQLQESASSEADHTPERNAALRAVREGGAKLVATPCLAIRSGMHAKIGGSDSVGERECGTVLEVEPIVEYDTSGPGSVYLNFKLEHHTAEPQQTANGPKFFPKKIATNLTLSGGTYLILGNWSVGAGRCQIAFVTVNIQTVEP